MDEYVSRKEAAALLGVSVWTLDVWVTQGLLTPRFMSNKKNRMYNLLEVQTLRDMRETKGADIWSVKVLALQALSTARVAETKLGQLLEQLGFGAIPLARDEAGIRDLYAYAAELVVDSKLRNVSWVRFWAGAFFAMDEVYFELLIMHTRDDEPWRQYMNFANEVTHAAACFDEGVTDQLRSAYRYFEAGKRHLWYIAYMTCRKFHGRRIADRVFNGAQNAVDEILAILH